MTGSGLQVREIFRFIREDYRCYRQFFVDHPQWGKPISPWLRPGFVALFLYRWNRFFYSKNVKFISRVFHFLSVMLTHAEITPVSEVGTGHIMLHTAGIILASAKVGSNGLYTFRNGCGGDGKSIDIGAGPGMPVVGDRVRYAPKSFTLGPCHVGDDAVLDPYVFLRKNLAAGQRHPTIPDNFTEDDLLQMRGRHVG